MRLSQRVTESADSEKDYPFARIYTRRARPAWMNAPTL